jgi:sugar lactone lactonase YvrE
VVLFRNVCVQCWFTLLGFALVPAISIGQTSSPILPGNITTIGSASTFRFPSSLALDSAGNIFIADTVNQVVRRIDAKTQSVSIIAGNGQAGFSGDGGVATGASLSSPTGVAVDTAGSLYIADHDNNRIRKVIRQTGTITTVAGSGTLCTSYTSCSGDGGLATAASLNGPTAIAVDTAGNIYFSDTFNNVVRKVDVSSKKISSVIAVPTTALVLNSPAGLGLDGSGNLYIADTQNNVIRKVVLSTGVASIVAGNGTAGFGGDSVAATSTQLRAPFDVRIDPAGNLYIADFGNNCVRFVNAKTGIISTIAGNGIAGYAGDGGSALGASLNSPVSVALDLQGNVYIADSANNAIRQVVMTAGPISANPTSLSFASQAVGALSGALPVVFTNSGNSTLSVASISLSSPNFTIKDNSCGQALSPGAKCSLNVMFSPQVGKIGALTAALVYADSAGNAPQAVALSGMSLSGQAAFNPSVLSFGNLALNAPPTMGVLTLKNSAASVLSVNGVAAGFNAGSGFSIVDTTCAGSLAAEATCQVRVQFSPQILGAQAGALNFITSASVNPQSVPVTATVVGIPQATLSIGSLVYSYQNLDTVSAPQSVVLSNAGTAPLKMNSIAITGTNASEFSATNNCGVSLPAGANCTISVNFTPIDNGTRTASLIVSDAVGSQTVALSGTGSGNYSIPGCTVLSFVAGPNPIYTNNPFGITSIIANVTCPYEVRIGGPNGPLFATGNGYSSTLTGNWVSNGLKFYLQQSGNTSLSGTLANLTVQVKTGQGCIATAFTASPNPIVTNNPFGRTTITAATNCSFDIRIGAPNGPEFKEGRGYNVLQTGDWVSNQMTMYLQPHGDTSAADTLSVLTLVVQPAIAGCTVNDFSAGQNPIITTERLNTANIHADASCPYDIRVGSPNGALLGSGQGSTTAQTGNWVVNGMSFYLQQQGNTSPSGTMSTFTVNTKLPDQTLPSCTIMQFAASPNPITAPGASTTVSVNANCPWDLRLNDSAGQLLTSGNGAGSAIASSVTYGTLLYLQPQGDTNWRHNLAILKISAASASRSCTALVFSTTPIVADAAFGVTNITADATCPYDIRVDRPDGALFGSSVGLRSANTGNWVVYGQVFYLQKRGDTTPAGTLATNAAIIIP